jgi:hypothetical protein
VEARDPGGRVQPGGQCTRAVCAPQLDGIAGQRVPTKPTRRAWMRAHCNAGAVHAMFAIDYKKARELFGEIPAPRIPRLSCEDALVYDPSIFYATAGEVAARAFSAKEAADEEPFQLLLGYTTGMSSPAQVAPVARMLAGTSLKPAQFEALVDSFVGALTQLTGDDRSFSGRPMRIAAVPAACRAVQGFDCGAERLRPDCRAESVERMERQTAAIPGGAVSIATCSAWLPSVRSATTAWSGSIRCTR